MIADIIEAWNEAEELNCSLRELNDKDLIDCREALINRSQIIMNLLDQHVPQESSWSHYLNFLKAMVS